MRRDDIAQAVLDGRHTGELLAHPCACGKQRCTLGEHIWDSTRDMTPGPRAQSFEPATTNGNGHTGDQDPPPDRTTHIDREYQQAIWTYWQAARDLRRLIDTHRPDRWTPLPDPATDDQWCRNHLDTIGQCEPRWRGDLCKDCYELGLTYGTTPDAEYMRARHTHGYRDDRDLKAWLARRPTPTRKRRKKAS
jgi:hypothetical protein